MANSDNADVQASSTNYKALQSFIVFSLIGILIFLVPVTVDGKSTIVLGLIMNVIKIPFNAWMMEFIVAFIFVTALGAAVYSTLKPAWMQRSYLLKSMFETPPIWLALRMLGAAIAIAVYFQVGPAIVLANDTGGTVVPVIGPEVFFTVLVACTLLPFLTDFGLLEFTGTLLRKPFEKMFTLPGRAAIDATSSLVAASSVGLLLTIRQYEDGRYSAREAVSIATNFSIVSLPFSLVVANVAKVDHIFFPWYLTMVGACIICATITVRLRPLRQLPETYFGGAESGQDEAVPAGTGAFSWALKQAKGRAAGAPPVRNLLLGGTRTAAITLSRIIAPSMAIATTGSVLVFHTPVITWLAWPFAQVLALVDFPAAAAAAPAFIAGFLELLLPALIAAEIDSEVARFVLAGLSVSQLIYMSEVGVIILRSSLPLGFVGLLKVFLLRTAILFPLLWGAAHLVL